MGCLLTIVLILCFWALIVHTPDIAVLFSGLGDFIGSIALPAAITIVGVTIAVCATVCVVVWITSRS